MLASKFAFLHVYGPHMVLQRRKKIVFQGTADPGCDVVLEFDRRTRQVRADSDGYWRAEFPALEAGGPYSVTLSGAEGAVPVTLEDLLIGELWICTGQSNMAMPVWSDNPFWRTLNAAEEAAQADHPQLRLYQITGSRLSPYCQLRDLKEGAWRVCNPESVKNFSACGYFFGRKLQQDLHVPIGLVNVAWGGTPIEAWIPGRKFAEYAWTPPKAEEGDPDGTSAKLAAVPAYRELLAWVGRFNAFGDLPEAALAVDFDDAEWPQADSRCIPLPGREAVRLTFTLDAKFAGQAAEIRLSNVNDVDRTCCNGTFIGETGIDVPAFWQVERKYAIPSGVLRAGKNVLTVIADNHYTAGMLPENDFTLFFETAEVKIHAEARRKTVFAVPEDFPVRPPVPSVRHPWSPYYPSTLFNARVAPWTQLPMRGTIWYQGCNNRGEFTYYPLHQMLIDGFREAFADPDFAFLLVQLAGYHENTPEHRPYTAAEIAAFPVEEHPLFAVIREIQAEMPHLRPRVGMVTAVDCGDAADLHPRDKQTVGARLAAKAEAMVYQLPAECDSPEFAYFRIENDKIRLFFRNSGSGLTTRDGQPPRGFTIGDRTGKLCAAEAVIEGDSVVVSAEGVANPQRVRYAFAGYCEVNLCSKAGLPVLPFRTDKPDYRAMFPLVP